MDADAPRTRSSATASLPDLRLHDPDQDPEPVTVPFPRFSDKVTSAETPQQPGKVVLGTAWKSPAELDRIRNGDVIVLDRSADSPLALVWKNEIVAWVELVQLEGVTAWKVVELASAATQEAGHE